MHISTLAPCANEGTPDSEEPVMVCICTYYTVYTHARAALELLFAVLLAGATVRVVEVSVGGMPLAAWRKHMKGL